MWISGSRRTQAEEQEPDQRPDDRRARVGRRGEDLAAGEILVLGDDLRGRDADSGVVDVVMSEPSPALSRCR